MVSRSNVINITGSNDDDSWEVPQPVFPRDDDNDEWGPVVTTVISNTDLRLVEVADNDMESVREENFWARQMSGDPPRISEYYTTRIEHIHVSSIQDSEDYSSKHGYTYGDNRVSLVIDKKKESLTFSVKCVDFYVTRYTHTLERMRAFALGLIGRNQSMHIANVQLSVSENEYIFRVKKEMGTTWLCFYRSWEEYREKRNGSIFNNVLPCFPLTQVAGTGLPVL